MLKIFAFMVLALIASEVNGHEKWVVKQGESLHSIAIQVYGHPYYEKLIKKLNHLQNETLRVHDTLIISSIDTLAVKSGLNNFFSDEFKTLRSISAQDLFPHFLDKTDSTTINKYISEALKKSKKLKLLKSRLISRCDSLTITVPKATLYQLESAANVLSSYQHYLSVPNSIYSSKNIESAKQHLVLTQIYLLIWALDDFK